MLKLVHAKLYLFETLNLIHAINSILKVAHEAIVIHGCVDEFILEI